jgi:ATP-binding cassette subfamily F protein 3
VLSGLGFDASDFTRPIPQLSGGQRTRAYLAKLLLSNPDLLILDEPTNHLDIAAVEWLEGYMSQWEGATLLVSHDRYFLDKVVDHLEMSQNGIEVYRVLTGYVQQRQDRWDLRQQIFETEVSRLKRAGLYKTQYFRTECFPGQGKLKRLSRDSGDRWVPKQ